MLIKRTEPQLDEADVVRRALALRKDKRIGVLWAERGAYWVSENEVDPYGSRRSYSLQALAALVRELETENNLSISRKPVRVQTRLAEFGQKYARR